MSADKKYFDLPELPVIEAQLDTWLYESQRLYEEAVKKYIEAKEQYIDFQLEYERQYADEVEKLKGGGEKVTIVRDLAQRACWDKYEAMLHGEVQKRRFETWMVALENRSNMLKFLCKRKWNIE
jgi:hypothetical protein